ncbi:MAG: hypothetical protein QT11_C0001G0226 [archaeon GW2011_AR20]|nr:MAG: hypothetical protein QT11_C0001G0226 [archaeon GW2011_AR20]MBS3160614.1 hypothetical protein [Candidatus Woesearchaeota archaeon]
MATAYNIETSMEPNISGIPNKLYFETVDTFRKEGLLGRLYVNHFGRVSTGYDSNCPTLLRGRFEIFYRTDGGLTMEQLQKRAELTSSGFDAKKQESLNLGRTLVDAIENVDPISHYIPFAEYSNYPIIPSMELMTSCGRQSVHAHIDNGGIIQFWKPCKDPFWYDRDIFKNLVYDAVMDNLDLEIEDHDANTAIEKIRAKIRRAVYLYNNHKILRYEPTLKNPNFPEK